MKSSRTKRDWGRYFTRYGARERFFEIYSSVSKERADIANGRRLDRTRVGCEKTGGWWWWWKKAPRRGPRAVLGFFALAGRRRGGAAARPASPLVLSAAAAEPLAVEKRARNAHTGPLRTLGSRPGRRRPGRAPEAADDDDDDDDDEAAEEDVGLPVSALSAHQLRADTPEPGVDPLAGHSAKDGGAAGDLSAGAGTRRCGGTWPRQYCRRCRA